MIAAWYFDLQGLLVASRDHFLKPDLKGTLFDHARSGWAQQELIDNQAHGVCGISQNPSHRRKWSRRFAAIHAAWFAYLELGQTNKDNKH